MFDKVFKVFDEMLNGCGKVVVAYSGGKDSTMLSLILYDWVLNRGVNDLEVLLVNSDTLSEIPAMREWAIDFMHYFTRRLSGVGVDASYAIYVPKAIDTFYWRVLVRGYPAPTFKFRWCVHLLKRRPVMEITRHGDFVLLLGHRDEESPARSRALRARLGFCPLSAGRCSSYYLQVEGNARKVYPIRELTEKEVWNYLELRKGEFTLGKLFELYGYGVVKARYGCWHCTLVKHQIGHYILGGNYLYLEVARLIYKWLSDVPEARATKDYGYSRLSYLLPATRSIMLYMFTVIERLSGLKLYGLDESKVEGYTLREIFYILEPEEADRIICRAEANADKRQGDRLIQSIEVLRHPDKEEVSKIMKIVETKLRTAELKEQAIDVLNELEKLIR